VILTLRRRRLARRVDNVLRARRTARATVRLQLRHANCAGVAAGTSRRLHLASHDGAVVGTSRRPPRKATNSRARAAQASHAGRHAGLHAAGRTGRASCTLRAAVAARRAVELGPGRAGLVPDEVRGVGPSTVF
jgi:hypothetical protein